MIRVKDFNDLKTEKAARRRSIHSAKFVVICLDHYGEFVEVETQTEANARALVHQLVTDTGFDTAESYCVAPDGTLGGRPFYGEKNDELTYGEARHGR